MFFATNEMAEEVVMCGVFTTTETKQSLIIARNFYGIIQQ